MDVFFLKPGDRGFFGVREALASMGERIRVRSSLYRGVRFPLTYPLPKRLDPGFQAYTGLFKYELIVLADVDPEVLTPKQMRDIVSYVEQGGGLLLIGGPHSFATSMGTYAPWESILPVEVTKGEPVLVDQPPVIATPHPITAGIPLERLETVAHVDPLTAKPDDQVLLTAGDHPLLIVGRRGSGRVLVFNAHPEVEDRGEADLFRSDFYDDLLRQAVAWLVGAEPPVTVEHIDVACAPPSANETTVRVTARNDAEGSCRVTLTATHVETDADLDEIHLGEMPLAAAARELLDFPVRLDPGHYDLRLTTAAGDGSPLLLRDWSVEVCGALSVKLETACGRHALVPGSNLTFSLGLRDEEAAGSRALALKARVIDFTGCDVACHTSAGVAALTHTFALPDVASGAYHLVGEIIDQENGAVLDRAQEAFTIVDPLDREDFYPIISDLKEQVLDDIDLRERIDEIADKGFNTLSMGLGRGEGNVLVSRVEYGAEAHALSRGMALNANYSAQALNFSRDEPPELCIREPGYHEAQRQRARQVLREAAQIPRFIKLAILDEPLFTCDSVCYCDRCRSAYLETYGREMPRFEEIQSYPEAERIDFFDHLSHYGTTIFESVRRERQQVDADFDTNHTFCQLSFGIHSVRRFYRDAFAWAPYCDSIDFDVYPFMYRLWRGADEFPFQNVHYNFAGHRSLCRYFDKPMGFFVEIDDRNYPQYVVPAMASCAITYAAIGQGANYLKTFVNFAYSDTSWGVRQERYDALGVELNKIRRYSPLLTKLRRPRARLAVVYPFSNWLLAPRTQEADKPPGFGPLDQMTWDHLPYSRYFPFDDPPLNAFQLLLRAYGETDLLHERMVAAGELDHYEGVVLLDTEYLPAAAAEKIAEFVRGGGSIIADRLPEKDTDGKPLGLLDGLFDGDVKVIDGALNVRRGERSLLFSQTLQEAYSASFEEDEPVRRRRLEASVSGFLRDRGILSYARSLEPDCTADLLYGEGCAAVVLVNQRRHDARARVEVRGLTFTPGVIYDMATMEQIPFAIADDVLSLEMDVDSLNGRILGLYPEPAIGNRLELDAAELTRGENLSYRVILSDESGEPAPGHHVIDIEVRDPQGQVRGRYGGLHATTNGRYETSRALAINEPVGEWTVAVYDRHSRTRNEAGFRVR